ncbi:type VI secretion system baseplate subunit TssG [Aquisalimonas asiatica]|uniref:Type VI secretion system protein ImpH n=1 Tax=Aquisalimonas asiatica TaxID=406100 RepID=A0A1H8UJ58_9GAMM|nr:type VI secretion system baseplate subunit TssG [Aquisalimonas asiatica]SEP03201.1 type VI secretion system protein ImpH [Aquisalimonas asiatica]
MDDAVGHTGIPAVRDLLQSGHAFSLRQAVLLLERAGLRPVGEGGVGGYVIRPSADLSFPAGEIRRCTLDAQGRMVIETDLFALHGSNSPLPHYWIDAAASEADDEGGQRVRHFLDWINGRVHAALAAGWRATDGHPAHAGWARAFATLAGGTGGRARSGGGLDLFQGRRPTCAGVRGLVQRITGHVRVEVEDRQPVRFRLPQGPQALGGTGGPVLGEDLCLGRTLAVGSGRMRVRIGPTDEAAAVRLGPGSERGGVLRHWLGDYLGGSHRVDVDVVVRRGRRRPWPLGSEARSLGVSTWLGDHAPRETAVRMTHVGGNTPA